jgi:hypothetical protein
MKEKIGDVLVRIGAMNPLQVKDVLARQKGGDKRLFGEIAIERGYIDDAALKRWVEYKSKGGAA